MSSSLNGILLVDKPEGITSHDVVARIRRVLQMKSVGHAGTLDPFATGLLIILIGEATKISDYLRDGDKTYLATGKLGVETNTLDRTGTVVSETHCDLHPEVLTEAILSSQGEVELHVPIFSAVKVKGEALYKKARKDIPVDAPIKEMHFYNVKVESLLKDQFVAQVSCKKGGYIRAWAQWIGKKLSVGGHLLELRRVSSSGYELQQAVTLPEIEALGVDIQNHKSFIPLSRCLPAWSTLTVKGKDERLIVNGQVPRDVQKRLVWAQKQAFHKREDAGIRILGADSRNLLALLNVREKGPIKIKRVFKYQ